jgi:hypothetical protein
MSYINPDWTCDERNEPRVIIIKHTDLKTYLTLKAAGWRTLWTGNGKICLKQ